MRPKEVNTNRNKSLVKNSLIIAIGTIFTKLVNFIMLPFYTNWLSPSEYGNFDLISTFVFLGVSLSTLQLEQALYRYTLEDSSNGRLYFSIICKFLTPIILMFSIVSFGLIKIFKLPKYVYFAIVYYICLCFFTICLEYIRGLKRLSVYSLVNIILGALIILFNYLFVRIYTLSTLGMVLSFSLSYSIISIFMIIYLKPFTQKTLNYKNVINQLLVYSIPLIPNSVAWWVTNISDRMIITLYLGSAENGIYAIANKLPTVLFILYGIFNLAFQQTAIETLHEDDTILYFNKTLIDIIKLIFSSSYLIITSSTLLYIFFIDEKYNSGLICVFILLAGVIFLCIGQFCGSLLLANKNTKIIGLSTILSSISNLILNIFLIPKFGIIVAAFTTTFSYVIMVIFRLNFLSDIIDKRKIFNQVFIYFIFFIIFSYLMSIFKFNIFITFIFFIITLIIFIIINKNLLYRLFLKKIRKFNNR